VEAHTLSSAELIAELEGVLDETAPGPKLAVAVIKGAVQEDRVVSLLSVVRKEEQPELISEGMYGFAVDAGATADAEDDWAKAAVAAKTDIITKDFIIMMI